LIWVAIKQLSYKPKERKTTIPRLELN